MLGFFNRKKKLKKAPAKVTTKQEEAPVVIPEVDPNSELAAVIGLALTMYVRDIHDYENMILTINKVMRPYSPWSSKIYGMRQIPPRIRISK